jgi:hypothetical protein
MEALAKPKVTLIRRGAYCESSSEALDRVNKDLGHA